MGKHTEEIEKIRDSFKSISSQVRNFLVEFDGEKLNSGKSVYFSTLNKHTFHLQTEDSSVVIHVQLEIATESLNVYTNPSLNTGSFGVNAPINYGLADLETFQKDFIIIIAKL